MITHDPDRQVLNATSGLGCAALVAGLILIPPLFLPAFILYKIAVVTGVTTLHPVIIIVMGAAAVFGLLRLGGTLIRRIAPRSAQLAIGVYVGACYTFVVFQRELTTAMSELDAMWLLLGFAVFTFIGWKVAEKLVARAHSNELARATRRNAA